ncbi:MAG: zf-TFIIB domain-containing protein [Phycisphaerae bacterium]|nr:zf-TFIIB domain-containing protein [Phycisphaerae bacterium]
MKCPHCDIVLSMSERQGVEIDVCPKCRGIWLDRGELDKILDRARALEQEEERLSREDRRMRDHPRRKSFWQELFD